MSLSNNLPCKKAKTKNKNKKARRSVENRKNFMKEGHPRVGCLPKLSLLDKGKQKAYQVLQASEMLPV